MEQMVRKVMLSKALEAALVALLASKLDILRVNLPSKPREEMDLMAVVAEELEVAWLSTS